MGLFEIVEHFQGGKDIISFLKKLKCAEREEGALLDVSIREE